MAKSLGSRWQVADNSAHWWGVNSCYVVFYMHIRYCPVVPFTPYSYAVCIVFILHGNVCVGGVQGILQYSCM